MQVLCLVNELRFEFSHINLYSLHLLILKVRSIHPLQIVHLLLQSLVGFRPCRVRATQVLGRRLLDEIERVSCRHDDSSAASDDLLLFGEQTHRLLFLPRFSSWISVCV